MSVGSRSARAGYRWRRPCRPMTNCGRAMASFGIPIDYHLPDDEAHVWRAGLDCEPESILRFQDSLSGDERQRVGRFLFEADRKRHIIGRGLVRLLLGHLLGVPPRGLVLVNDVFGKPSIAGGISTGRLEFNLSHSGDVVLVAVARTRRIGVDVEAVRTNFDIDSFAKRFFSAREHAELAEIAPAL